MSTLNSSGRGSTLSDSVQAARPWRPLWYLRRKVRKWAKRRQGTDATPFELARRRVYILPSLQGLAYAGMVMVILLGSMNYNNNLGLGIAFLLAAIALVGMHYCHRNLCGLRVLSAHAQPVFAGQQASFVVRIANLAPHWRYGVCLHYQDQLCDVIDLPPHGRGELVFAVEAPRRGAVEVERINLSTSQPFALFTCWAWVYLDLRALVYPRPADKARPPSPTPTDTGGAQENERGDADFAGLRDYRDGDSPRHIAWKSFARDEELRVKQFAGTDVASHWFDWREARAANAEGRLSIICRWILDARRKGDAFGLRLPGQTIDPAFGRRHAHRCLAALAEF